MKPAFRREQGTGILGFRPCDTSAGRESLVRRRDAGKCRAIFPYLRRPVLRQLSIHQSVYCTVMVVEAVTPLAFAPIDVVPTP